MKTLLLLLSTVLLFQGSGTQKLESSFNNLKGADTKENQILYFNLFPSDFRTFERIFGYVEDKPGPLYEESFDYISRFFELDKVSKKEKISKAINIGINGKWEADAISHLQQTLEPLVLENVDLTYQILKGKQQKEIESFFYFLFGGPHPKHTIPTQLHKLKGIDRKFYSYISNGHRKALKESVH
ncbi:hypothetical protein H7F15_12870 [Pontibacter sp. Tf4]|uniref:hypothetical protein n=1 Tax=Pontibacter sp. Tf4 TaxID=2761620 RepID=UPI001628BE16|nr:hypothetical protein [Pontibacter sp. Tf4]MBB6611936.1 hypothetical protein [Pontibacter sp. Tf4]